MRLASEAQLVRARRVKHLGCAALITTNLMWCVVRRRDSDTCPEAIDEGPNYNRIFIAFPVERNSGMDSADLAERTEKQRAHRHFAPIRCPEHKCPIVILADHDAFA
jgi:hypothetical protein